MTHYPQIEVTIKVREKRLVLTNRFHSLYQFLNGLSLGHIALNADLSSLFHKLPALVHGQDNDGGLRGERANLPSCIQAVQHRHSDVEENQIRMQFLGFFDCLLAIGGFRANLEAFLSGKRRTHTLPDRFLIVRHQNSHNTTQDFHEGLTDAGGAHDDLCASCTGVLRGLLLRPGVDWNCNRDFRSLSVRFDFHFSAEILDSFAYAPQANTRRTRRGDLGQFVLLDALPLIPDAQRDSTGSVVHANARRGALGMAMDVRKAFLYDAEDGDFQIARQPSQIRRQFQSDGDTASLPKSIDVPAESGFQTHFLEQRRVQQVGKRPQLRGNLPDNRGILCQALGQTRTRFPGVGFQHREIHAQESKRLAGAVVQIAGDAPPFVILHAHQTRRKLAQALVGEVEDLRLLQYLYVFLFGARRCARGRALPNHRGLAAGPAPSPGDR